MSETVLRFIPEDPEYVPGESARGSAHDQIVRYCARAEDVHLKVFAGVQFIDQGGNFERVRCPICGATLEDTWWQRAMDAAWEGESFGDFSVTLPCCGAHSTLHDLRYEWPADFDR